MPTFLISNDQTQAIRLLDIDGIFIREEIAESSYSLVVHTPSLGHVPVDRGLTLAEAKARGAAIVESIE